MPRVTLSFLFGETQVIYDSTFQSVDLLKVKEKAIDMMLASRDPDATLKVNDVLVLGIALPPAQFEPEFPTAVMHVEPGMHHSIVEILEWDQVAFVVGNSRWEIGIHFMFGDHHVTFDSSFASHKLPAALNVAKDICGTLGFWEDNDGAFILPLQEPYYFQQLHTPTHYPTFWL
jgi:hypothetical protein